MKKQINLFKVIIFIVVLGMFFLLPLCACQRKTTTTTEKITTTEKTTEKYNLEIVCEVEQTNKIVEYIFIKENDTIKWILKDELENVYEGVGITTYARNRLWKDEEGLHLDLTFDAYKYVLSII